MKMTELVKILEFLRGCYPVEFRNMNQNDVEDMLASWSVVFADGKYAPEAMMNAAKRHVMGENGRSFPTPRDILERMEEQPDD